MKSETATRQGKRLEDTARIRRITWAGLLVNMALAGLKLLTGTLGASQAVIADALHSMSDLATDLLILLGVGFWSAPPDSCHPYGHDRLEALVTMCLGLLLGGTTCYLVYWALTTIGDVRSRHTSLVALWGPVLSIIAKEVLYRVTVTVGRKSGSSAVIANAWHHRSDALSSIPALIAVVCASINPSLEIIDNIGALVIASCILYVSLKIISPALMEITDHSAPESVIRQIRKTAMNVEGVENVHAIRTRRSGPGCLVDLHIIVAPDISVRAGHDISEAVKTALIEKCPGVIDALVHIEPG